MIVNLNWELSIFLMLSNTYFKSFWHLSILLLLLSLETHIFLIEVYFELSKTGISNLAHFTAQLISKFLCLLLNKMIHKYYIIH